MFEPDSAVSQNLAAMLACQAALNYGLFCRSMVFHGIFDENDRQFIRDMAENTAREIYVKKFLEPNDVHAGEIETSTSLAIRPHLVRMELAKRSIPQFSSRYLDFTGKRGIAWHAYTQKISAKGVLGDPTRASAEKGRRIWEIMFAHLVALVEDLKTMSLEEIHQKDY